ncbi:hypothetical protein ACPV5Z_18250 [Vibrio mediterranei]
MTQAAHSNLSSRHGVLPLYFTVCTPCFLCGEDGFSGQSFEHRRVWIVERTRILSQVFAIDVGAYAIMFNHYHLVLHV